MAASAANIAVDLSFINTSPLYFLLLQWHSDCQSVRAHNSHTLQRIWGRALFKEACPDVVSALRQSWRELVKRKEQTLEKRPCKCLVSPDSSTYVSARVSPSLVSELPSQCRRNTNAEEQRPYELRSVAGLHPSGT